MTELNQPKGYTCFLKINYIVTISMAILSLKYARYAKKRIAETNGCCVLTTEIPGEKRDRGVMRTLNQ